MFTRCHIVSVGSSKTGISGALQHLALFICWENNGGRCNQLCRSLGQAQCYLSVVKCVETNKLCFEEISKGKCEKTMTLKIFVLHYI